jgi:helicase
MLLKELTAFGAEERLIGIVAASGVDRLNPPQELAVKAGLFRSDSSFVIAAPTASGKTLIAEMAFLSTFLNRRGRTVYLVPLKALAREKYEDFTRKYKEAGLRVVMSSGDFDPSFANTRGQYE